MAANKKMEMEFGLRVSTHSILKDFNNGRQKNLVFSPLSLHTALNMLTAGAKGPTLDQLLRFLDSQSVTQLNAQSSLFMELATTESPSPLDETLNRGNDVIEPCVIEPYSPSQNSGRGLIPFSLSGNDESCEDLTSCSGPIISLINGIWVDQRFPLKHSFKQLADDVYKAKSQSVDFLEAKKVANDINFWAKEVSKGHIDKLVSPSSLQDSILVLASALYFKGSWLQRFDPKNTGEEDFRLLNGKRVKVPFMKRHSTHNFYRSFEGFKLLKMEYKKGQDTKNYAMYIFLPDRYDGLQELIQKFHCEPRYFTQNHEFEYVKLNRLWLPKVKYEYGLDMVENIRELGLDLPFEKCADFTEIVDHANNVYVSKMIQKSYIEVNEEGTVATSISALATAPGYGPPPIKPPPLINFVADHPFLYMIKEEKSGIVLFVGAAFNPLS